MNMRVNKRIVELIVVAIGLLLVGGEVGSAADGPYMATGLKIGEVTDTSAIVWARLTLRSEPNPSDGPVVTVEYKESDEESGRRRRTVERVVWPNGATVADIQNAAPGASGQVRVNYRPVNESEWSVTDWYNVDAKRDFTVQVPLAGLVSATRYEVHVESRAGNMMGQSLAGGFQTAPDSTESARIVFTVSTGQAFGDQDHDGGYYIYPTMLKLDPSFFVHTGDIVYYDRLAKTIGLARYHWQRTYSRPTNVAFHRQVASYFVKDDHDAWVNDCWPNMDDKGYMGEFTFEQGLGVFREQVPMGPGKTYRTYRWGKDLQIWLPEGRDYRSPNNMADGPEKTIWGAEQKAWFKQTVQASDATFRLVISPTPIVGPDRENKSDNHSNKTFRHEGDEIRQFLAAQKNMAVICGDRHWQYMSVHPTTGVREYSCGPASDKHAGGWKQSDYRADYHQFLAVQGGFLSVTIQRVYGRPTATFRYHDIHGKVRHEDRLAAE